MTRDPGNVCLPVKWYRFRDNSRRGENHETLDENAIPYALLVGNNETIFDKPEGALKIYQWLRGVVNCRVHV